MIRSIKVNIYGKVQGVGFRYSAMQKANEIGITGFVKNRTDGSVFMEIEAEPELIDEFIFWCKEGPTWSVVDDVVVVDIPFNNYKNFSVK
jgi:acylphosphatase